MLGVRYVSLVAALSVATLSTSAARSTQTPANPARLAPQALEKAPRAVGEPITAIISLKSQLVTFYDAEGWTLRAPVSTGTKRRETPAGIFAILEKKKDHHSSLYDDAWMPHMQRITWNGIALHGGPLPGYAASHGCVRMPYGFAKEVFDKTWIGMRVIISPNDVVPVAISHPVLFQPNALTIAAAPTRAQTLSGLADEAATAANDARKAAETATKEAAALVAKARRLEKLIKRAALKVAAAEKAVAAADKAKVRAQEAKQAATDKATDLATQFTVANANADKVVVANEAASGAVTATNDDERKAAATATAKASSPATSLRGLEIKKRRSDATLASTDKAVVAADRAKLRAADLNEKAVTEAADIAAQLMNAKAEADAKVAVAAGARDASQEADDKKALAAEAADEARLALEPVSVYISRATQKLYVRRNTHKPSRYGGEVFDASVEVPVTIRDPERSIGTHVFTAVALENGVLRWTAVTINGAESATEALNRITIPQEILDRIAPTALPRSSIIVSDEHLSRETNHRTEFVAVLSDYPQGGFITRSPSAGVRVAKRNRGIDFFSSSQPNSRKGRGRSLGDLFRSLWQ